jgi:squalene cyclase
MRDGSALATTGHDPRHLTWPCTPPGRRSLWRTRPGRAVRRAALRLRGHPALGKAARWLLTEEMPGPGDWRVRSPGFEHGGWAFEFDNDNYPDTDDTTVIQ